MQLIKSLLAVVSKDTGSGVDIWVIVYGKFIQGTLVSAATAREKIQFGFPGSVFRDYFAEQDSNEANISTNEDLVARNNSFLLINAEMDINNNRYQVPIVFVRFDAVGAYGTTRVPYMLD